MSENTKLWDILGRTDPAHTKSFTRGGGFKGTALKPMWSYRRMTEEFGPCGTGWGVGEPSFQVVPGPEGEVLVYCTASIWYGEDKATCYGVGGDKVVGKNKYGLNSDDEAFKKAFTDAVTNALKLIGVGADVHMGLFDDSKYVNTMRQEFSDEKLKPQEIETKYGVVDADWRPESKQQSSAELTRQKVFDEFMRELDEIQSLAPLAPNGSFRKAWRERSKAERFNDALLATMKDQIERREAEIMASMSPDALAEVPLKDALQKSLPRNTLMAGE